MKGYELPRKPPGSDYADLLSQNGPHRQFKTIPTSGRPKPGTFRDQGREQSVMREMRVDRIDVSTKVE